jgi:hypothetical protein
MEPNIDGMASRFSDRILRLLEQVEHRVAKTSEDREMAFRLRYDAYVRNGLVEPRGDARLYDQCYDDADHSWITMTFIDGELVGTTRVNLAFSEDGIMPAYSVYPDAIGPKLKLHQKLVEFTRTAARLEFSKLYPELPYITLRPGYLAAEHFSVDYAIASARTDHVPFFRRIFGFVPWSEPREYPAFTAKVACLGADFFAVRNRIEARYPFFRSTQAEREALFGPAQTTAPQQMPRVGEFRDFDVRARA